VRQILQTPLSPSPHRRTSSCRSGTEPRYRTAGVLKSSGHAPPVKNGPAQGGASPGRCTTLVIVSGSCVGSPSSRQNGRIYVRFRVPRSRRFLRRRSAGPVALSDFEPQSCTRQNAESAGARFRCRGLGPIGAPAVIAILASSHEKAARLLGGAAGPSRWATSTRRELWVGRRVDSYIN